jgi:predicted DCC family thiol-disulfide oxidoreductase YuxK
LDQVVLFDGVCNFCAHSVQFILAHERDHVIRFAANQSDVGRELLRQHGFAPDDVTTFVFIEGGRTLVRSDASLALASHLRQPWRLLRGFRILPRFLRDGLYNLVARNRYRLFGRRESCLVPTQEVRARFLDAHESAA